ncbi:hypothetical protein GCM10009530_41240 [Microbispora corallina]|uniref:Uncharacterized protein n=1 Tax=Microbispora corallina TaxID=83302 RepID=A0ABQ4GCC0_9ACTN|nr:hypothetical protein Mco01_76850 [Microbispora corallina]
MRPHGPSGARGELSACIRRARCELSAPTGRPRGRPVGAGRACPLKISPPAGGGLAASYRKAQARAGFVAQACHGGRPYVDVPLVPELAAGTTTRPFVTGAAAGTGRRMLTITTHPPVFARP